MTFFAKNVIEESQISKSREKAPLLPRPCSKGNLQEYCMTVTSVLVQGRHQQGPPVVLFFLLRHHFESFFLLRHHFFYSVIILKVPLTPI